MSLNDLASFYKEDIDTRLAAARQKVGEKNADVELKHIAEIVTLLETEARQVRNPQRKEQLLAETAAYRKEIGTLLEEAKRRSLMGKAASARVEPETFDDENPSGADRDRERRGGGGNRPSQEENARAVQSSRETLKRTLKAANEIEEHAAAISADLDSQTATINRVSGRAQEQAGLQATARNALRQFEAGETRSKIVMYGAVLLVTIGLIVAAWKILF